MIVTQDRLPKSLTQAFQAERWMDFARALGVAVDNENSLLRTAGGPVLVTAVPWRFGRETLSLRRPHPDDVSLVRTGREMSATARCPWVLLAHDPPAPSKVSTNKDENATRILVRAFQPDICVSGHLHQAPFAEVGDIAVRIDQTLCINPGRVEGTVPRAVALELVAGEWRAKLASGD